ncbi:alpha/beta hydrolase [Nocardioides sp. BGMRC 2183]|nr:alpha/beta hydrolase [Nocardioides sp. BGMRC 2183]
MTTEVIRSEELFAPLRNGIELCYQTFGDPDAEPLLLVMGLGGPMIWWDDDLCRQLAAAGFYVIRYDNRDIGRSTTRGPTLGLGTVARGFLTGRAPTPYRIAQLAEDAFGLLDHLDLPAAHVTGVSMGGMIAQTMALAVPHRVLSLTSIMSTTGRRSVGRQHPQLLPLLFSRRRDTREAYVESSLRVWNVIGSPAYPTDDATLRQRAGDTFDRGVDPAGVLRQMAAITTQPDRTKALGTLSMPTLVLHGTADKMVHVSGGRATAAAAHGAELVLISGMGHDLPPALFDTFTAAIRRNANRAG